MSKPTRSPATRPPATRPPATRVLPAVTDVDIRLLRVFRTVVESGGFSAAEVELNISRAAISLHMADLERRLGLRLCRRGRAGFLLTDEGRLAYEATLRLLAGLESFRSEINAAHGRLRGELNIGITDNLVTLPQMRVTNALGNLKRQGPEVRVNIRMIPPNEIERGVLDGRLHVGVVPARRALPGLDRFSLYQEESRLYCGRGHPLFEAEAAAVTPAVLAAADAVAPTEAQQVPDAIGFQRALTATATATDREGVAFLILTGCYLGFLPTHYARQWVERGAMRALLPDSHRYSLDFHAVTKKGAQPNLVLERFLALLKQTETAAA
ncbi:LysR family transcriptional regulator [Azospirillum thermophilum]|uniref:LysR family transcriptional regulator n=1 Tax=Azospirillum thermophilum TaxID=2202148 RepID=A0A2S2CZ88_9PROT|nr:LysR family transcriptional regulator [Azospirillum thermophilum]AWK89557.1 LysR family transcriptional regulator [Azospirillum thermophilum]